MEDNQAPLTVHTPRRSKVGLVIALMLLLVSAGLLVLSYWAWQQHLQLAP